MWRLPHSGAQQGRPAGPTRLSAWVRLPGWQCPAPSGVHQLVQDVCEGDHPARHQPLIAHIHPAAAVAVGRGGATRVGSSSGSRQRRRRLGGSPTPTPNPAASSCGPRPTCAGGWPQSCPAPRAAWPQGCGGRGGWEGRASRRWSECWEGGVDARRGLQWVARSLHLPRFYVWQRFHSTHPNPTPPRPLPPAPAGDERLPHLVAGVALAPPHRAVARKLVRLGVLRQDWVGVWKRVGCGG